MSGYAQVPRSARAVLEQLSTTYSQMPAFSIDFTYELKQPGEKLQNLEGKGFFQGNMYRLFFGKEEIYNNGQTQWVYLPESKELTITTAEPNKQFELSSLLNSYRQGYRYRILPTKTSSIQLVELVPLDKTEPFFKIQLKIDVQSLFLHSNKIFYKDGSRHTYHIHRCLESKKQSLRYFSFDTRAQKNLDIIDLR